MEQHQSAVRLSVGTKLLISIVSLLFIVILFLNISTILLLKDDKRAYIYQSQSTEAVLAGRELINTAKHGLDTLRLALASVDPRKPVTPQGRAALNAVIENQSEAAYLSLALLDLKSGKSRMIAEAPKAKELSELQLSPSDFVIEEEWMKIVLPELEKNSFAFVNLSKLGGSAVLGLLVADQKLKDNPLGMPIAIGAMPLGSLGKELSGLNFSVTTRSGWILFDTDPAVLYSKKNLSDDPLFASAISNQVASGAQEYDFQNLHFLGSYVRPGLDLVVLNRTEWRKAISATYALTEKFILLGIMAIGLAIVFAIVFSKSLTAPINQLYEATKEVAQGNFKIKLEPWSKDEIGALTGSFNVMSEKIEELIEESVEKVQIENELAIASTVQQTLIPPPKFENENLRVHSSYMSASQCGGDWWGFFGVGRKFCFMIADATGHGFPSALITASARSCFSVMQKLAQEDPDFTFSPGAMLAYANRVIYDASMAKIMMTFFIGVIDFDTMQLTYSNAGHNPPWLFKKSADRFELKSLVAVGPRLGEARDVPQFDEKTIQVDQGDVIFIYTDGVTEGKNTEGDMFGKKRLRKLVEGNLSQGPEKVITELVSDFQKYNIGKSFDDDVTIAAMEILASSVTPGAHAGGVEGSSEPVSKGAHAEVSV